MISVKRAYEPRGRKDGTRILVDRLWPRGVSRAKARIDFWFKDIAPSGALRQWFGHEPRKWQEFQKRYRAELASHRDLVAELLHKARRGTVTLVYAAKDETMNNAVVLRAYLQWRVHRGN